MEGEIQKISVRKKHPHSLQATRYHIITPNFISCDSLSGSRCESESEFDGAYYSCVVEGTICEFCLIEGRAHAETQARLDCTFKKDGDSSWR